MKKDHYNKCLALVQKYFPYVEEVVDASFTITITVKNIDVKKADTKEAANCPMARACVREKVGEGAIINLGYSYLINGKTAMRYKTSTAVARELTCFDRGGDFYAGLNYKLSKISASNRIGANRGYRSPASLKRGPHKTKKNLPEVHYHRTSDVRISGQ